MRRVLSGLLALSAAQAGPALVHTERAFEFTANASMAVVAPLFGADRERVWAEGWSPRFVWPSAPQDREGMVFTVDHDGRTGYWINTAFDLRAGRIQYVYVVPERLVTRISLTLTPQVENTHVQVTYERTALSPDANAQVETLAASDAAAGPEWGKAVNGYLASAGDMAAGPPGR